MIEELQNLQFHYLQPLSADVVGRSPEVERIVCRRESLDEMGQV